MTRVHPTLYLPDVTLVCVDTHTPELALDAMQRCREGIRFADAVLFTEAARVAVAPAGIRIVDVRIASVSEYSRFMLRSLGEHLHSSHLLVVQWDGFVLDPAAWQEQFLRYDYIGAPWHDRPPQRSVGNGGFSLRSRRLLDALLDPAIEPTHPEDVCICEQHRQRLEQVHGLSFAPPELAQQFAFERMAPVGATFGFHGLFNFHRVFAPSELRQRVAGLPDAMMRGRDGHDLCRSLIDSGELDIAELILGKRRHLGLRDRRTLRLRVLLLLARRRSSRHKG